MNGARKLMESRILLLNFVPKHVFTFGGFGNTKRNFNIIIMQKCLNNAITTCNLAALLHFFQFSFSLLGRTKSAFSALWTADRRKRIVLVKGSISYSILAAVHCFKNNADPIHFNAELVHACVVCRVQFSVLSFFRPISCLKWEIVSRYTFERKQKEEKEREISMWWIYDSF